MPMQLPPVTRAYITLSCLTTAGCALDVSFQELHQPAQPFLHDSFQPLLHAAGYYTI